MSLRELTIRNFAIIKHLEIEIEDGLTVVTGETGAGKSIVLGALNLLLGARAEADLIRHEEDQCEITALFEVDKLPDVTDWLESKDLLGDEEDAHQYCLIRRIVRRNKPTKCYINDQPTRLSSLRELGLILVDLHGQHEHQSLLRRPTQRQILDQFADHDSELVNIAKIASHIHRVERELDNVTKSHTDSADRMELMSFQLNELNEAAIAEGEFEQLEAEHARLSNAKELISGINQSIDTLYQNEASNVSFELGKVINDLVPLADVDKNLSPVMEILNSSLAQLDDAQSALDGALSKIEQDPERLQQVEQRRDTLINLARKHRCKEGQLAGLHLKLKQEYEQLENLHLKPEKLQAELIELRDQYLQLAVVVSENRQQVAKQLSATITEQMQGLGMQGGEFSINVEPIIDDSMHVSEHGYDRIEYLVSSNHGMPLKSLQKTASGGELSRISLAIQVITGEKSHTPCLVFDEVDVGVGGKIASIVGQRLRDLGTHSQVICITHQPQVAAQANHHLFVDKVTTEHETYSTLIRLGEEMRTEEVARMLGGSEITDRTKAHAQEMLSRVGQKKSKSAGRRASRQASRQAS